MVNNIEFSKLKGSMRGAYSKLLPQFKSIVDGFANAQNARWQIVKEFNFAHCRYCQQVSLLYTE